MPAIAAPWMLPLLFAVYTVLSVGGMLLVKHAAPMLKLAWQQQQARLWPGAMVAGGAGMYAVSFMVWMVILARAPLSTAYPIAMGLTLSVSTLCAVLLLREHLSAAGLAGIVLIFAGVALVARN